MALNLARRFLFYTSGFGAGSLGVFLFATRKSQFESHDLAADALYNGDVYKRFNPNGNRPALHDVCVRRVPVGEIRAELLQGAAEGKLAEAFCAGLWSGVGYEIQRRYLQKKYRGPETAHQLWDRPALASSTYPLGTQITDHFEVVAHTPTSIVVRAGDSPRKTEPRESDGLFEMSAVVKEEEGVAEFRLKSFFFKSKGTVTGEERMPEPIAFLHRLYTKLWMETALKKVLK